MTADDPPNRDGAVGCGIGPCEVCPEYPGYVEDGGPPGGIIPVVCG